MSPPSPPFVLKKKYTKGDMQSIPGKKLKFFGKLITKISIIEEKCKM